MEMKQLPAFTAVWRQDISLVCSDGVTVAYPKLVAGLVFPDLAACSVLQVLIRAENEPSRSFTFTEYGEKALSLLAY